MRQISPAWVAIFLGGVCVGLLISQTLELVGRRLGRENEVNAVTGYQWQIPSAVSATEPQLTSENLDFLTEQIRKNGSVLDGTLLAPAGDEAVEGVSEALKRAHQQR